MASPVTFRTPYDTRLELVTDIITTNSRIDHDAASELAAHIIRALNSIPEKIR